MSAWSEQLRTIVRAIIHDRPVDVPAKDRRLVKALFKEAKRVATTLLSEGTETYARSLDLSEDTAYALEEDEAGQEAYDACAAALSPWSALATVDEAAEAAYTQ